MEEKPMKIASILCDGGEKKDYRRNIYLSEGRLLCDGNDITQDPDGYGKGRARAERDVIAMYSGSVWDLELI